MKKIIVILLAILAMGFYCTLPIMAHAEEIVTEEFYQNTLDTTDFTSPADKVDVASFYSYSNITASKPYYFGFKFGMVDGKYVQTATCTVLISSTEDVTIQNTNSGISLTFESPQRISYRYDRDLYYNDHWTYGSNNNSINCDNITMIMFDFENANVLFYNGLDVYTDNACLKSNKQRYLYEVKTNLGYEPPESLSLGITFQPTLNGAISRSQTLNGKLYTSDTLDMIMTNNGDNAQFAWFIVPQGGSISFPSSIAENNSGFIGSPVYAYVTDEWIKFGPDALHTDVLSPCAWHAIPSGYTNQYYSVPWGSMMLEKNTQYDCVVYACLSDSQRNVSSPTWSMSNITVDSNISEVVEVYRSTFSIIDPAEFKAQNEGFGAHPWNPTADNSSLFQASSAFKDDNGNVVIAQSGSGFDIGGSLFGYPSDQNISNIFKEYFAFINAALSCFPSVFITLLSLGMSGMIVIGIIKVVKG